MILAKFSAVVLLAALVVAEVPSYFDVCGRRNPNLDQCVLDAYNKLLIKLKTGIPEIEMPPVDPLMLEGFTLSETPALKAYAHNISIRGLTESETRSFHVDLEKYEWRAVTFYKKLILEADYDINARILVPIAGRGPIHVEVDDLITDVTMKWKMIKKNGVDYIFYTSMTTKIDVKDYSANFKSVGGDTDNTLTTAINAALKGAKQEILQTMMPNLEKIVSEQALSLGNKIASHFSFDELFPDRE